MIEANDKSFEYVGYQVPASYKDTSAEGDLEIKGYNI